MLQMLFLLHNMYTFAKMWKDLKSKKNETKKVIYIENKY